MSAPPLFTFQLRWPSGELIAEYVDVGDMDCEQFMQHMDEGLIQGIPHAATDESGNWLEHYIILLDLEILDCGKKLSDYEIPAGATLTVVCSLTELGGVSDIMRERALVAAQGRDS